MNTLWKPLGIDVHLGCEIGQQLEGAKDSPLGWELSVGKRGTAHSSEWLAPSPHTGYGLISPISEARSRTSFRLDAWTCLLEHSQSSAAQR